MLPFIHPKLVTNPFFIFLFYGVPMRIHILECPQCFLFMEIGAVKKCDAPKII